jgi:hypothetical protein
MYKKLFYLFLVLASLTAVNTAVAELVAYYPLNEGAGTTAADASGKNHNGTIQGTPTWVDGSPGYGKALYFNGQNPTSGWVNCGTWNPSAGTGQLSVAFWAKWGGSMGSDQWQGLVSKRDDWDSTGAGALSMWEIEIDATTNVVHFFRGGSYPSSGGYIMPVGQWVHIAVTFNGTTAIFYVNGTQTGSGSFSFGPKTDAIVTIGCDSGASGWNSFNGSLDEVRLYNNALTPAEIKALAAKYGATNPNPADGAKISQTSVALSWTAGAFAETHHVFFGDNYDAVYNGAASTDKGIQAFTVYWAPDLQIGKTYYWRVDEVSTTQPGSPWKGAVWSFTIPPKTAWQPNPADLAKYVDTSVTLSWSAGLNAILHHVYLGTNLDAVKNADTSDTTGIYRGPVGTPTSYTPPTLAFNTDYYWRVDEFDAVTPMNKGPVWSFTTTPPGLGKVRREIWENITGTDLDALKNNINFPSNPTLSDDLTSFDSPEYGDNYGGRLHGWLHVPVAGDYTFWVSGDDQTELWLSTDDDPANAVLIATVPDYTGAHQWEKYPSQQSQPITLQTDRYYIMALWKEGEGGDNCSAAWQGPGIPTRVVIAGTYMKPFEALWALGPKPSNRATDVSQTTSLSWKAGEKAAKHDVYFGTNEQAVANANTTTAGIYRGRQNLDATGFILPDVPLEWAKTYYWRIDEVNDLEPASPWQGAVWSFTTANFIVVDDFEQYTDDVANRIFRTWLDGWGYTEPSPGYGGNGTGSAVGYAQAPFAEQTIVHSGKQSMPLAYDNSGTGGKARYSETQREWTTPQDWTTKGVKALTLWFHGDPNNAAEPLYVAVKDSLGRTKVVTSANPDAAISNTWQEWNIDMKEFISAGLNLASVKTMYIGLGNRVSPKAGGTGTIYIDDIRLYLPRCIASVLKPAADLSGNCVVDQADVEIIADLWLDSGFQVTPADPGTTGLVAYYPFNGNANDTVGGHNGTIVGTPTYAAGKIGQAIQLNGVDQMVDVGAVGISGAAPRTIAGWSRANALVDALPDWIDIFGFTGPAGNYGHFDIELVNASSRGYGIHVYGWERNIMPIDFEWHHLAASYDGTTIKWYGDGRLIGSDSTLVLVTPDNVHMGMRDDNTNYWPGRVDEVRIYSRALSDAQIAWLAGRTSTFSIPADLHQDNVINFKDFAVLADSWLDELLWPQP